MKYSGKILAGGGFGNGASRKFAFNDGLRAKEVNDIIGIIPFGGTLNVVLTKEFDFLNHPRITGKIMRIKGFIGGHTYKFNPKMKNPNNFKFPKDYELQSCSFFKCKINNNIDVWIMRFDIDMYDRNFIEVISHEYLRSKYNLKTNAIITLE